ncbi:TetR/AcrR family transcriptional regulator [Nocardioides sp. Root140]|uniref:TetR/AcrR family transcriptional regulator n=1 Tax=Nocardioides sp. Root140 TaxID=1736460 RepID=UPI0006F63537|nr:TetR/AcrR family transcriptional regulator [Nocardioides sp. Root140]KQY57583.1 TetR family transcriptional regulator [Nocardioides sp. Root140]
MTSTRHNIHLDAARGCILDLGWKRTTLTEVARRAGVSRMTIYRAWPDMQTLLADLMTREWGDIVATVPEAPDDAPTPRRIADGIVAAIGALRENPLMRRILDVDPELLLPYLLVRRGRSQQLILEMIAPRIAAGQKAGHVRAGDPQLLARTVLLAAHGFTLSAHTMADDTISEGDLGAALADLITGGLTP